MKKTDRGRGETERRNVREALTCTCIMLVCKNIHIHMQTFGRIVTEMPAKIPYTTQELKKQHAKGTTNCV